MNRQEQDKKPINLAIKIDLEPGGIIAMEPDETTGTLTIYARFRFDFTGDIREMAGKLAGITVEGITGAITGAMVDILGEEITEGGCHVQYKG